MDRKLLILGIIFFVAFISFVSVVFLDEPIARFTRAADPNTRPSPQTSLIFAWPLDLAADGKAKSDITVFIRDRNGRGLEGQRVRITTSLGTLNRSNAITDNTGKAIVSLTSSDPGIANIDAFVDNTKLLRTISVQFKPL